MRNVLPYSYLLLLKRPNRQSLFIWGQIICLIEPFVTLTNTCNKFSTNNHHDKIIIVITLYYVYTISRKVIFLFFLGFLNLLLIAKLFDDSESTYTPCKFITIEYE